MRIENYLNLKGILGASGLFFACGSFGVVDGDAEYTVSEEDGKKTYTHMGKGIILRASFEERADGVVIRRDRLENTSDEPMEIYELVSRFTLPGNDYEVYTQYNGPLHENIGDWQKLVTQVRSASFGTRSCDGAAPVMALHDLLSKKNIVFHLLPNAKWSMTAKKVEVISNSEFVLVETGFDGTAMHLSVAAGASIELPTVIFFVADSKTDLDAYKLHNVYNEMYPRRSIPILYNSWLYCYDNLDIDELLKQADCAAELGFEAFMIDAGWFGEGKCGWGDSVGDWSENLTGGPCGRLLELSERVRSLGMIFGLWFEPERASAKSRAVAEHPDYYLSAGRDFLLDFSNPDAVDFIFEKVVSQIDKYSIGWIKLDFNGTLPTDPSGDSYYYYFKGQRRFVERLRERYPELYITNCAGGGRRMDLYQAQFCDSFWLSDNQGPYGGLDIVKNSLKRMPGAQIERWNVQKYAEGFPKYGVEGTVGVMLSCNNATWDFIINVDDSFTKAFLAGGVVGFSCDIAAFPDRYKESWKQFISEYKTDRDFYINAAARILADTEPITVIEYFDCEYDRCEAQIFTKVTYAPNMIVYLEVDKSAEYILDGKILDGRDIAENGIFIEKIRSNRCYTISLKKVNR